MKHLRLLLCLATACGTLSAQTARRPLAVPGEYLIRLLPTTAPGLVAELAASGADPVAPSLVPGLYKLTLPGAGTGLQATDLDLNRFSNDLVQSIDYAHPNYYMSTTGTTGEPSDPEYPKQWGLHRPSVPILCSLGTFAKSRWHIRAPMGWAIHTGSTAPRMKIAVIDTGCALVDDCPFGPSDPVADLLPNLGRIASGMGYGWDYVSDAAVLEDTSSDSHGTRVASIIGAKAGPSETNGMAGIVWDCEMYPFSVSEPTFISGSGILNLITVERVVKALAETKAQGIRVSNNSYGASDIEDATALRDAIAGMGPDHLFVCAAGNSGVNIETDPFYPASFGLANMIVVTSYDYLGNVTENYGPAAVDIAAPGDCILSRTSCGFGYATGSSFATAHATGAVALLWSHRPTWSGPLVKATLLCHARRLRFPGLGKVASGALNLEGLLD